ncbi:MAG TPA: DUF5671 domain-containing protein [Acidimicrobiia bacterium]
MGLVAILVLLAVVLAVVIVVQRSMSSKEEAATASGADIVAYLVLAIAMGVAGFALANLASTAFPGETFIFDPAEEVATSLSALVVSVPFLVYFWRRQAHRRATYPGSAGWTLYLSLVELVFMTAFVISTVSFLDSLITGDVTSAWTGVIVFGAIVVFHEYAVRNTPPLSDAGELRRVLGSAIGLITTTVGLIGVLTGLFGLGLEAIGGDPRDLGFEPWLAMLVVGAPIWWYRWLRPWDSKPGWPKLTWTVAVVTVSLAVCLGAGTSIVVMVSQYVFTDTSPAGQHFESLHVALSFLLAGLAVWVVHRREMRTAPNDAYLVYAYAIAAIGLATSISMAIILTISTFSETLIVGRSGADVVTFAVVLVAGAATWLVLERRATGREGETAQASWPRRLYTLGLGAVLGLIAAGALITTIFVLLRRVLADSESGSVLEPLTVLVYTGLASFYLLRFYAVERAATPPAELAAPFHVTIICSHPGMIASKFPSQAKLRVLHHDDAGGAITEQMADQIVYAVGNRNSYVWVDGDGFRIASMRMST